MFSHEKQNKLDWQQIFLEEKLMGEPQAIPQSIIYELVNETINKEDVNINCPRDGSIISVIKYIIQMPLTHSQFLTIPSPLSKRNDNYYPLTLVMSVLWIWVYTWIIVWWTYDCTVYAFDNFFSLIPMFLFPLGVMLRDIKKFDDFRVALKVFRQELPDQEISLAESYSPQIF